MAKANLIEELARELWTVHFEFTDPAHWDHCEEAQREQYRRMAEAAVRFLADTCELCDGTGHLEVTHDMAIDACNLNLSGQLLPCGSCSRTAPRGTGHEMSLICVACGKQYDPEGWDPMGGDCPNVRDSETGELVTPESEELKTNVQP